MPKRSTYRAQLKDLALAEAAIHNSEIREHGSQDQFQERKLRGFTAIAVERQKILHKLEFQTGIE